MPLLWTDTLSTGLRQIDLQHQELVDMINVLEDAFASGQREQALALLQPLNAYVLFHFATEEALLDQAPADHAAQHRAQHQAFTARVDAWRQLPPEQFDMGEMLDYLKRWLVEHILKTDRELGRQVLGKL